MVRLPQHDSCQSVNHPTTMFYYSTCSAILTYPPV
jgi:hypothetical protein